MPEDQAAEIACQYYGVQASAHRLPSEHDDTFRLALTDGTARFLRISPPDPALAGSVPTDTVPTHTVPTDTGPAGTSPAGIGPSGATSPATARVSFLTAILLHLATAA